MKILKIFLIVILVIILLAVIGGYIFFKNFDVNSYKPQIIKQASAALHRQVNFDNIDLNISLKDGIRVKLSDFSLLDDPHFQTDNLLKVKTVYTGVNLMAMITKKEISISSIEIIEPFITVIRDQAGIMNVEQLGKPEMPSQQSAENGPTKTQEPSAGGGLPAGVEVPLIFIKTFHVENAQIIFVDKMATPEVVLQIKNADIDISNLSLNQPFDIALQAAVLGDQDNISLKGKFAIDIFRQIVSIKNTQIHANFNTMDIVSLKNILRTQDGVIFPESLQGQLEIVIKEMTAGASGVESLSADVAYTDGMVKINLVEPKMSFQASQLDLTVTDFSLSESFAFTFKGAIFGDTPNISAEGNLTLNPEQQSVRIVNTKGRIDLALISFSKIKSSLAMLKDVPIPETADGRIDIQIKNMKLGPKGLETASLDTSLTGGMVNFKEIAPGIALQLKHIDFKVNDMSLNDPFPFSLQAAYLSDVPNINTNGTILLNMPTQSVRLSDTKFSTDLSTFDMVELQKSMANLKVVSLPEDLGGKIEGTLTQAKFRPQGLEGGLLLQSRLTDGMVKLKELLQPISNMNIVFVVTESKADLNPISMKLGEGTIEGKASVQDYLVKQTYQADLSLDQIDLAKLIDQKNLPNKIEGFVKGNMNMAGQGFDPAVMTKQLSGDGGVEITEGRLKNINILRSVLEKIPGISEKMETLPERYKAKLENEDTILEKVNLTMNIADGSVLINPIDCNADGFLLTGEGTVGFDTKYSVRSRFSVEQELSTSMAAAAPELEMLLSPEGEIYLPLVEISGKGSEPPKIWFDLQVI